MPSKKSKRVHVISQELLADFEEARRIKTMFTNRAKAYREQIIDLHDENARVEPGPLQLTIKHLPRLHMTRKTVEEALGKRECDRLVRQLPTTRTTYLYIRHEGNKSGGLWLPDPE